MEPGYTLPELCDLADVSQRTVRYYIAEGLLRSPGQGPAARYDEGHLLRLRLIRRLQRSHLPLAEIRNRLRGLNDDEVRVALAAPASEAAPGSAVDYVRSVLAGRGVASTERVAAVPPLLRRPAPAPQRVAEPAPAYPSPSAAPVPAGRAGEAAIPAAQQSPEPERSQWERIALSPDIELHVRRPLSRLGNRQLARLVEAAREILQEGDS